MRSVLAILFLVGLTGCGNPYLTGADERYPIDVAVAELPCNLECTLVLKTKGLTTEVEAYKRLTGLSSEFALYHGFTHFDLVATKYENTEGLHYVFSIQFTNDPGPDSIAAQCKETTPASKKLIYETCPEDVIF